MADGPASRTTAPGRTRGPCPTVPAVAAHDAARGSAGLLVLMGGGMALLLALVLLVVISDLVISRGRAQQAADAAALAAMGEALGGATAASPVTGGRTTAGAGTVSSVSAEPGGHGRDIATAVARANGAALVDCCGDAALRRQVTVAVVPSSRLLRMVVPRVRARAAAALVSQVPPSAGVGAGSAGGAGGAPPSAATQPGARRWPVTGRVSSGFGMRAHPVTGGTRMHTGLDLAVPAGTPIRAAAAGRVVRAGTLGGYGQVVDLAHGGGVTTRYAHQSHVLVAVGQQVAVGQVIGLVGATGTATGPHLHMEVRTAAGPIDPRTWLPPADP